ncbi:SDR family oxidoreductase [Amycolatopsis sp. NPDC001319]|uniref:SDR family oxidoreductase n=1 Tax=unclassified Amycolatopsis TaxID=2618356 RepID=UPI00367BD2ED
MGTTLESRTAVVTGGSSGIGLATARLFADEGAHVVITGRNEARLRAAAESIGPRASWIAADLAREAGARSLAAQLAGLGLRVDVLFANAGAANAPELFETTEDGFDANLKSAFFTVTACFDLLADGASVILTSSVGFHRGTLGDPLYTAAKAGVRALGRGFAGQPAFLDRRVRVNTLSFGAVATPLTGADNPDVARAMRDWATANVPVKRPADPLEAAGPALFLAGAASSYLTGGELAVDGGLAQL